NEIDRRMDQIQNSYLPGMKETLWKYDNQVLNTQLLGIMQLPDIEFVEIKKDNQQIIFHGDKKSKNLIFREFPLKYLYRQKEVEIGILYIAVSLDNLYQRLIDKAIIILVGQSFKTFVVSFFIFFLFFQLIGKHIKVISDYLINLDLDRLNQQTLDIGRNKQKPKTARYDELNQLELSINKMREKICLEVNQRIEISEKLKKNRALLQTIIDNIPVLITMYDPKINIMLSFDNLKLTH
ncbi:MAG: hypothetical protein GY710_06415, partial [Desulfobacteraceae bacterium]|nr:hypothetical protein [Desulfobacteraceae bacterium]